MKILKFSGIVAGIHLLALILIFANPGCSSSTKPAPAAAKSDSPPTINVPGTSGSSSSDSSASGAPPAISFNPEGGVRYSPTRPGTPAASTLQAEPVNNVTPATTYTIVSGDSLSLIAKKNHLTVAELAAANNLNASTAKLRPGQKLIIPSKVAAPAKTHEGTHASPLSAAPVAEATVARTGTEAVKHTVKSGETLSTIARKYGVKQGDIAVANNISDPQKIRVGMELVIPGWQAPAGKTGHAKSGSTDGTARHDAETKSSPPVSDAPVDSPPRNSSSDVPVIQVEEAPAPAPAK